MVNSEISCELIKTNAEKRWPYQEYYIGERDKEKRKNGKLVQNFWSGAESLEYYKGPLLRDTMHGVGVYRWRHRGPTGTFVTYEGHFFNNRMHGYGAMSYPDGRVFTGLYHNNVRWGPGVESHAFCRENVGLWNGTQLIRLIWKPLTPSVTPDFTAVPNGKNVIIPFRIMLTSNTMTIGAVNSAIELLKTSGLDPITATEKWTKLYPIHCTDLESQLCYKEVFERGYHKKKIHTLEEVSTLPEPEPETADDANIDDHGTTESFPDSETMYAWNNNRMVLHIMKHCYKHERQRSKSGIELTQILNGPRTCYKPAAQHELDCRTLLMASYLGHITNVAQLINECNVNPNIADIQGNTALLYATCGDQADVIHFLVEAGADVNSYNDACCTPLGVSLVRLACAQADIQPNAMVQALLPNELPVLRPEQEKVLDWNIVRDGLIPSPIVVQKTLSKTTKLAIHNVGSAKKIRSGMTINDLSKKKGEIPKSTDLGQNESDESSSGEKRLYNNILHEYSIKVNDIFLLPNPVNTPYIFEINDMSRVIDSGDDDKKLSEKISKRTNSKVIKPSKDMMWKSSDKEVTSIDSMEKLRLDRLSRMMLTILQLLTDGADPVLVRFPQPALYIACLCGSADLIRHLVNHGADVNETYPQALGYTPLDIVVSGPLTFDNLDMIRTLVECGALADRKLTYTGQDPNYTGTYGPTLLHAVLAKKPENETEDDIRQQVLELLLRYRCNSITQFRGRSAVDIAISKSVELFDVFIRSPRVDLNAIINDANQSVLVKMFSMSFCKTIPSAVRLQTLTNLLLFGADPLIECYNGEETYQNLFVFARKELEKMPSKPASPPGNKGALNKGASTSHKEVKGKKSDKFKKDEKLTQKSVGKVATGELSDYKQALDLVIECARLLHIRWIQAKLMKDLIETVDKFKQRNWVMILKEIQNKRCTGLWLTTVRCLEIWDILKSTKKRKYNDEKILVRVLCIVHFYFKRKKNILKSTQKYVMTAKEKEAIESEVDYFLQEHKLATMLSPDMVQWKRPYVTPELTVKEVNKFHVCFECALPFDEEKIVCSSCKLIAFCSLDCMQININRVNCHPCSEYLQKKYFPFRDDSVIRDLL